MGFVPSAETVHAVAYLTDTGRNYLFNKNNNRFDTNGDDFFKITKFSLSDVDINYRLDQTENSLYKLSSGEIPDITGESQGCLKTTANYIQSSLIAYEFDNTPIDVEYTTDRLTGGPGGGSHILSISESLIPDMTPLETVP